MPQRPPVFVHLLPALIPAGALKGGVAVVIDILRATTTMIHALGAGCDAIIPCGEIDEARQVAASMPAGTALLAGERRGLKIDGFDLGNSPGDCTPALCSSRTLVMTTTNGTRAILAALEADRVLIGAFVNAAATVEVLKADGRPIHLVCAGTDGEISLEDSMFAGSIAQALDTWAWEEAEAKMGEGFEDSESALPETLLANDPAEIAASLWRETDAMIEEGYSLADALSDGKGGRRVLELGLDADLEDAADVDRFRFAAELHRNPLRIVPSSGAAAPGFGSSGSEGRSEGIYDLTGTIGFNHSKGVGPAKVMPRGKANERWTWTSWSRSASGEASSSRRARFTAASTAFGITARSASS